MSRFQRVVAYVSILAGLCCAGSGAEAKAPRKLAGHPKGITALAFSPDGRLLVSAGAEGHLRVWDLLQGGQKGEAVATDVVYGLVFDPNGQWFAAAGKAKHVILFATATGAEMRRHALHTDTVAGLAVSPDGLILASGGYDKTIRLWSMPLKQELRRFEIGSGYITALAFSPDGKTLASGGAGEALYVGNNTIGTGESSPVRLWDVSGQQKVRELPLRGHRIAFSPDGKLIAAGGHLSDIERTRRSTSFNGMDRFAVVDIAGGQEVHAAKWRGMEVAFAPRGRTLVTAAGNEFGHVSHFGIMGLNGVGARRWDGRVRLWDLETGKEILRLPPENSNVAAVSNDGKFLATGASTGEILIWDIEEEKREPTPDPKQIIKVPPENDVLLRRLHDDYEKLRGKAKDPAALHHAALLFHQQNAQDALAVLRRQRDPAGIPLLLRYFVEEASRPSSWYLDDFVVSFEVLTGKQLVCPGRDAATVRKAVGDVVESWWTRAKGTVSLELSKMSKQQWQVIARRLLLAERWREERYHDPFQHVFNRLSAALDPEPDGWETWWPEDLHAGMIPYLLADTGYEETPGPEPRDRFAVGYRAVPLLAELRKTGQAPALHRIAGDARYNTAMRLTCLLALYKAGEDLPMEPLLTSLKQENRLERRLVAVLALEYGAAAKAVPALLPYLEDRNRYIRAAALEALRVFKPHEAVPRLQRLLDRALPTRFDDVTGALTLLAEIRTKEAQKLLASFLGRTLDEPGMGVHLWHALWAFEQATGGRWLDRQARHDTAHREAGRRALASWMKENP